MKSENENGGVADDWWKIKKSVLKEGWIRRGTEKTAREQEEISEGKVSGRLLKVRTEIYEKYIFKKGKSGRHTASQTSLLKCSKNIRTPSNQAVKRTTQTSFFWWEQFLKRELIKTCLPHRKDGQEVQVRRSELWGENLVSWISALEGNKSLVYLETASKQVHPVLPESGVSSLLRRLHSAEALASKRQDLMLNLWPAA